MADQQRMAMVALLLRVVCVKESKQPVCFVWTAISFSHKHPRYLQIESFVSTPLNKDMQVFSLLFFSFTFLGVQYT